MAVDDSGIIVMLQDECQSTFDICVIHTLKEKTNLDIKYH